MNKDQLLKDLERGHVANLVLDQIGEKLDLMAENIHAEWESSKHDDVDGREACWRQLKAVRELKRAFMSDQRDARLAQTELEKANG